MQKSNVGNRRPQSRETAAQTVVEGQQNLRVMRTSLLLLMAATLGLSSCNRGPQSTRGADDQQSSAAHDEPLTIGGEPVVTLVRPNQSNPNKPQFLEAIVLPGRGIMSLLQVRAYLSTSSGNRQESLGSVWARSSDWLISPSLELANERSCGSILGEIRRLPPE